MARYLFRRWLVAVGSWAVSTAALSQTSTLVRATGQVEVLTEPGGGAEGGTVMFDGEKYKSDKGKVGMRFKDGVIVKTGNESKATLIYQNGDMITIGPESFHMVLPIKAGDGKGAMEVLYGKVRAQIAKDGPHSGMEVKTRTAVMGVRGTDFYVKRPGEAGDSQLVVLRGEVAVKPAGTKAAPQLVKAGNAAVVEDKKAAVAPSEKATLAEVQKDTAVAPAGGKFAELEKKAAENILEDIKKTDPKLYEAVNKEGGGQPNLYALNTAAVENVYEKAPGEAVEGPKQLFAKTPPPAEPELTDPADDASVSTGSDQRRVDFAWQSVAGAARYQIQIASDAGFAQRVRDQTLTATTFSTNLAPLTFYWRVRAFAEDGRESAWSSTRRLSIGRTPAPGDKTVAEVQAPEPETKQAEEPKPEATPAPEPAPEEAPPTREQHALVGLAVGGGNYSYEASVDGATTKRSGGGGGLSLTLQYRFASSVEAQLSLGQRSYNSLKNDKDEADTSVMDVGGRYFFHPLEVVDLGAGLSYARDGLPHPSIHGSDLKTGTLEQLYAVFTVTPPAWPRMAWRGEIGYGILGGSTDFDVKKDKANYILAGYERQWFSLPLTLGLGLKRTGRTLTIREKDGLDGVEINLQRTDVQLKAGYAF